MPALCPFPRSLGGNAREGIYSLYTKIYPVVHHDTRDDTCGYPIYASHARLRPLARQLLGLLLGSSTFNTCAAVMPSSTTDCTDCACGI